jgi:hypothetical protein
MPRGGRRHAVPLERRAVRLQPAEPPRPPKGLDPVERAAWLEVAAQVRAARTYTEANLSAFKLSVKALAAVYAAPADLKPTTLRGLLECASRLLGRLGLDPIAGQTIDVPPPPPDPEDDRLAEYLK